MHFLDGTYYLRSGDRCKEIVVYNCKFYSCPGKRSTNGKILFESEVGMQIYKATRDLNVASIRHLVAQQWNDLPAEQKELYSSRAIKCNLKKRRCEGQLSFKRASDGQVEERVDALVDYAQHSDFCPYYGTNFQMQKFCDQNARKKSKCENAVSKLSTIRDIRIELFDCVTSPKWVRPPGDYKVILGDQKLNNKKRKLGKCKAASEFSFSSNGTSLKIVFNEEYQESVRTDKRSKSVEESEIEYVVID